MKNIVKSLIPCLTLLLGLASCYDTMDDKSAIDAQYALKEIPSIAVTSATALDFSTIAVNGSVSNPDAVIEVGFAVSATADFGKMVFYAADEVSASFSAEVGNLTELTTYYVKVFAMTNDGRLIYSEASSVQTLEAPRLSTDILDGKRYVASGLTDVWGEDLSFDFTLSKDEEDETIIWFNNLSMYFASYGYTAERGYNRFYGVLDSEAATITLPMGQLIGYGDVALYAYENADASGELSDLVVNVNNMGASLTFVNAFGQLASDGWWELYFGGITVNSK